MESVKEIHEQAFGLWAKVGRAVAKTNEFHDVRWSKSERALLKEADVILQNLTAMLYIKKSS